MAKSDYSCILYEVGDKVVDKHDDGEILTIEATDIRNVGIYPTQFLKFVGKPFSIIAISTLFIPAEGTETAEKYKDGLIRMGIAGTVKKKAKAAANVGAKAHERLAKALKRTKDNKLTPEDLQPVRRFIPQIPIKKKDVDSSNSNTNINK